MQKSKCFWFQIVAFALIAVLSASLFLMSVGVDYKMLLAREHTRFRKEMPTQDEWINSPFGKLRSYLFNVTNAEAFLNGTDTRIKFQEVGPITYKVIGYNDILSRNATSLIYRKHRYRHVEFLPEDSVSPDILNQTIILPNMVLLGATVKFHDWVSFVRPAFNALTINEKVFLTNSVYHFLWEFTTPSLSRLSKYVKNIAANCGMLHNALTEKEEVYNVKIGPELGIENFFRIRTLNNKTYFSEHSDLTYHLRPNSKVRCPIDVTDSLDNSMYPPFITPETKLRIAAIESCRVLDMHYKGKEEINGIKAYRYGIAELSEAPSCLDTTYGIKLHKGFFDISNCVINDAPAAFSSPHFYGTSYNWSQHFEGLNPNAAEHDPYILLEPNIGIPLVEKYRFQSNIPMPKMKGFNRNLEKFDQMVVPTFWYEFEMGELSSLVLFLIQVNIIVVPLLQPILMTLFLVLCAYSVLKIALLLSGQTIKGVCSKWFSGTSNIKLETRFPQNISQKTVESLESVHK